MGPLEATITEKIRGQFNPEVLQVTNESYMHSVPAGSESHFKLVVVSDQFDGKRLVQRHQAIYGLLAGELQGPVHALALHTYTSKEWSENQGGVPDSPNCLGGGKTD
jgi:BolA family transcriptional regulator, general stress-responsive regulator